MKSFVVSRCCTRNKALKQNYSLLARFFCSKAKEKPKSQEEWNTVVGLEIHAQILSKSKLFSGASTEFGSAVNTCVSFFDCATPGTLPVLNRKCVEVGVMSALALSCKVNEISLFDRKHYFYADLPAGYQITQQRQPLAVDGHLNFHVYTPGVHNEPYFKSSKLKQLQLEQDSGKSLHDENGKKTLIDLNRAGVPLMEFVFEPDLKDGEEAAALVKELMLILERLNACSCIMAEGAMRVDANVSINKPDEPLGVRTEIKNIGSVRAVASAIKYEIKRQIKLREKGDVIVNETRSWDVTTKRTVPMREKEEKQDYRFMPEPNLPPLCIHVDEHLENKHNLVDAIALRKQIPELPEETRDKLLKVYGLRKEMIIILVNEPTLLKLFLYILEDDAKRNPHFVAKTIIYMLLNNVKKNNLDLDYCYSIRDHICELIDLLDANTINVILFHKIMAAISEDPKQYPKQIVKQNNWYQINDEDELRKIIQKVLDDYPKLVKQYQNGKNKLFSYFVRQIVQTTEDRANVLKAEALLKEMLKK